MDVDFILSRIYESTLPCQVVMRSMRVYGFATILFLSWQLLIFIDACVVSRP